MFSNTELCCFRCFQSEQSIEQTVKWPVIWSILTLCNVAVMNSEAIKHPVSFGVEILTPRELWCTLIDTGYPKICLMLLRLLVGQWKPLLLIPYIKGKTCFWSAPAGTGWSLWFSINTSFRLTHLPPGQNGRRFADDIFNCIFMNVKSCILIRISLNFVPKGPIDNNPALV